MNKLIAKKACIFSLIFGAVIGLISLIPQVVGLGLFIVSFLSAFFIILFMKKNEKHLAFINNEQGAILGGIIGFASGLGFFISFSPMVYILHLIFTKYYSYAIPYIINDALWLFFIIIFMVCLIFALTNSAVGMAVAFIFNKFEEKPEGSDVAIDIKIED